MYTLLASTATVTTSLMLGIPTPAVIVPGQYSYFVVPQLQECVNGVAVDIALTCVWGTVPSVVANSATDGRLPTASAFTVRFPLRSSGFVLALVWPVNECQ